MRRASSCAGRSLAAARADVAAEGRALERLRPSAQLAQARERAGYLLDRATRALRGELARRGEIERRMSARLTPVLIAQLGSRRVALERSSASLAALGPQATLDRGYAIVRRRGDGAVVREPGQAPPGEGLTLRVARGEIAATVDREPGANGSGSGREPEAGRTKPGRPPGSTPTPGKGLA
jgi:exodeoxyribonuclease VII large subunit